MKTNCISLILILLIASLLPACKSVIAARPSLGPGIRNTGEDKYVKKAGWDLPPSRTFKKGETATSHQRNADGDLLQVTVTRFYPSGETITAEPLESIGYRLGDLKTLSVMSCGIKGRIFEYAVQVTSVQTDDTSDRTTETGSPFIYRYYDMDGDGIFETLITDSSEIPVPDWAQTDD